MECKKLGKTRLIFPNLKMASTLMESICPFVGYNSVQAVFLPYHNRNRLKNDIDLCRTKAEKKKAVFVPPLKTFKRKKKKK